MRGRSPSAAIGLMMGLVSLGCVGGEGPAQTRTCDRPSSGAVVCILTAEEAPIGWLRTATSARSGVLGSYCWPQEDVEYACYDFGDVPALGAPFEIRRGTEVVLIEDADRVSAEVGLLDRRDGLRQLERMDEPDLSSGSFTLDVPAGRYVLHIFGVWEHGDGEFFFPIEVTA